MEKPVFKEPEVKSDDDMMLEVAILADERGFFRAAIDLAKEYFPMAAYNTISGTKTVFAIYRKVYNKEHPLYEQVKDTIDKCYL